MEQQSITWPKGKRCAFSISFDLDGESPWIHRDAALAERPLHMSMGAYGPNIALEDRWAIVAYVRALQKCQSLPVAQLSEDRRKEIEAIK